MTYMLIKQVLIWSYFLQLEATHWASDWATHVHVSSKTSASAHQHKWCDHWSNRRKPDERNKEMTSLIRPLITRLWCETAAVLILFMRRRGSCVSAGLICTGSTCQTVPAGPRLQSWQGQNGVIHSFIYLFLAFLLTFSALFSSDPQFWKVQRPAGQSDGHWTDGTRRAVTGSSPDHVSTNQGDFWAEPLRFSFSCSEGQIWGSLSWVMTKINEMGVRIKMVWLLPFKWSGGFCFSFCPGFIYCLWRGGIKSTADGAFAFHTK